MNTQPLSDQGKSMQDSLRVVLTITVILSVILRMMAAGWIFVIFGILLLIALIVHIAIHNFAIKRISGLKPIYRYLILLSNLFFFLGFACQVDGGDGPWGYAGIVFGAQLDSTWSNIFASISTVSFIALVVSWIVLLNIKHKSKQELGGSLIKHSHTHKR